jgi:hypothetical protein
MRYLIVGLILISLVVIVAGCGSSAEQLTNPTEGPVAKADSAACAANRRTMESSLQQYSVLEGKSATSLQQLVPKYLQSVPSCPSGGTYSLQGSRVSCSIHGS